MSSGLHQFPEEYKSRNGHKKPKVSIFMILQC